MSKPVLTGIYRYLSVEFMKIHSNMEALVNNNKFKYNRYLLFNSSVQCLNNLSNVYFLVNENMSM